MANIFNRVKQGIEDGIKAKIKKAKEDIKYLEKSNLSKSKKQGVAKLKNLLSMVDGSGDKEKTTLSIKELRNIKSEAKKVIQEEFSSKERKNIKQTADKITKDVEDSK